jgi:hypothetical protein
MRHSIYLFTILAILLAPGGVCGQEPADGGKTEPPLAPATPGTTIEIPASAAPLIQLVLADAAVRADVEISDVVILSIDAVEWSDASLGCPQPDMMYAQVITPGFRVVVEAAGSILEYHTDLRQTTVLCGG